MRIHQPVNSHDCILNVLDGLLEELFDRRDTGGKVTFAGLDPLGPTVLKTGAASAAVAAASAVASAILWRHRGGDGQDVRVDLRKAFAYQSPWQDVLAGCTKLDVIRDLSVKKVEQHHMRVHQLSPHVRPCGNGRLHSQPGRPTGNFPSGPRADQRSS